MGDRLRVGGTMELAGLDTAVSGRRAKAILRSLAIYYEDRVAGQFADVVPWKGLRPCTPDGLPYLGRTRRLRNMVIATGHAMMGLSLGPITGKLVAEVLSGEPASLPLGLLAVDRFASAKAMAAEVQHA
jgi:D-amino-acid dehydrogenase